MQKVERRINQQWKEVEQLKHTVPILMHKKIKETTSKQGKIMSTAIKDANGNVLMEENEGLKRWEEYMKEPYQDNRGENQGLKRTKGRSQH